MSNNEALNPNGQPISPPPIDRAPFLEILNNALALRIDGLPVLVTRGVAATAHNRPLRNGNASRNGRHYPTIFPWLCWHFEFDNGRQLFMRSERHWSNQNCLVALIRNQMRGARFGPKLTKQHWMHTIVPAIQQLWIDQTDAELSRLSYHESSPTKESI